MNAGLVKFLTCFSLLVPASAHSFADMQSTSATAGSVPEGMATSANAERLAEGMEALSGRWSGRELKRAQVVSGPWVASEGSFDFSFDSATRTGEVSNADGETFSVKAEDHLLVYAGTVAGEYREQKRKVVDFRPLDAAGNMIVVAQYDVPRPDGNILTVQETYRIFDGQYIRRMEVRPAGTADEFVLIRDARFSRAE